jgi:hypothetical protein
MYKIEGGLREIHQIHISHTAPAPLPPGYFACEYLASKEDPPAISGVLRKHK